MEDDDTHFELLVEPSWRQVCMWLHRESEQSDLLLEGFPSIPSVHMAETAMEDLQV